MVVNYVIDIKANIKKISNESIHQSKQSFIESIH